LSIKTNGKNTQISKFSRDWTAPDHVLIGRNIKCKKSSLITKLIRKENNLKMNELIRLAQVDYRCRK